MPTLRELIEEERQLSQVPRKQPKRVDRFNDYSRLAFYLIIAFSVGMFVAGEQMIALYPAEPIYAQTRLPSQDPRPSASLLESYQKGELQSVCTLLEPR